MHRLALFGVLTAGLAGVLAVGCFTPSVTAEDPIATTESKTPTHSSENDDTTTTTTTTGDPIPVTSVTTTTDDTTSTTKPATVPGSTASDAGTTTMTTADGGDAGAITPGKMSAGGYVQNPTNAKQTGACTQSDIGYYDGLLTAKGVSYASLKASMESRDPKCAACMFSNYTDATWAPVVVESNGGAFFNWGACYALAPGGNEKCGNEVQQWHDCLNDVCRNYTGDARTTCENEALADSTSCGGLTFPDCADLDTLNNECSSTDDAFTYACVN